MRTDNLDVRVLTARYLRTSKTEVGELLAKQQLAPDRALTKLSSGESLASG